ncbi:hypothetical protein Bbelb_200380 [Branchiostoma belcheri]|nr:hypothetical protein Bbelb_200380 [Branchiostoma belcheri]
MGDIWRQHTGELLPGHQTSASFLAEARTIYHEIFFDSIFAGDKGSLCANMNGLNATTAKEGPHATFNQYQEAVPGRSLTEDYGQFIKHKLLSISAVVASVCVLYVVRPRQQRRQRLTSAIHVRHLCHEKLCLNIEHLSYKPEAGGSKHPGRRCVADGRCSGHGDYRDCIIRHVPTGRLHGRRIRTVIPSYVVLAIREAYLGESGQYTDYLEGDEFEKNVGAHCLDCVLEDLGATKKMILMLKENKAVDPNVAKNIRESGSESKFRPSIGQTKIKLECRSTGGFTLRRTGNCPMNESHLTARRWRDFRWERIAMDFLGPLPKTDRGNRHILVISDYMTKWVEAVALPNQEAPTVVRALIDTWISRFEPTEDETEEPPNNVTPGHPSIRHIVMNGPQRRDGSLTNTQADMIAELWTDLQPACLLTLHRGTPLNRRADSRPPSLQANFSMLKVRVLPKECRLLTTSEKSPKARFEEQCHKAMTIVSVEVSRKPLPGCDRCMRRRLMLRLMTWKLLKRMSKATSIKGHILSWLKAFLTERTQTVVLDGESSKPSRVTSGVPQGTSPTDAQGLQADLDALTEWQDLHISNDMRWDAHIAHATGKANRTLGVIRRNLCHCTSQVKNTCYKALVRPQLEYCASVWDPYTAGGVQAVERVQRRAARRVMNDYARTSSRGCEAPVGSSTEHQVPDSKKRLEGEEERSGSQTSAMTGPRSGMLPFNRKLYVQEHAGTSFTRSSVTDGEFSSLRTRGETRPLHLWQLIHHARDSVFRSTRKETLKKKMVQIDGTYARTSYLFAKNRTDTFDAKRRKVTHSFVSRLLSSGNEIIHLLVHSDTFRHGTPGCPSFLWASGRWRRLVSVFGLEDKRQITALLTISLAGKLLPPQLLYQGKTEACHPKFPFPEEWDMHHTSSHWSTEESMQRYVDTIITPYMEAQRDRLDLEKDQKGLAIFDVYSVLSRPVIAKLREANVIPVFVPASCTGELQPREFMPFSGCSEEKIRRDNKMAKLHVETCPFKTAVQHGIAACADSSLLSRPGDADLLQVVRTLPQAELDRNQIQPLKQRRQVGALTLLHRMYNQDAPAPLNSLLPNPYVHRRETRLSRSQHSNALEPVKSSTTSHRRTFLPATVQLWNSLPQDIVALKDRHKFKSSVNCHLSGIGQRPCDSC